MKRHRRKMLKMLAHQHPYAPGEFARPREELAQEWLDAGLAEEVKAAATFLRKHVLDGEMYRAGETALLNVEDIRVLEKGGIVELLELLEQLEQEEEE